MFDSIIDFQAQVEIFVHVLITVVLLVLVGIEREIAQKPAGLRTNLIVGAAACLIVSLVNPLVQWVNLVHGAELINSDPIRVLEAIFVGIGFIGAGTVLKSDDNKIQGLTTAATLLLSCGIGISVALGLYVLAGAVAALIILINLGLDRLTRKFTDLKK